MPDLSTRTGARVPCTLTLALCHGARLFSFHADLTASERLRLERTLDQLIEIGTLAAFDLTTDTLSCHDLPGLLACIAGQTGALALDAVLAAAAYPATPTPRPKLLVPVWPFEPEASSGDALIAFGIFSGMPIAFEAFAVRADLQTPVPSVADRFDLWRDALASRGAPGTIAIDGSDHAYAVFASVRAV